MDEEEVVSKTNQVSLKAKQKRIYDLSVEYLINNFHKFSEDNKIKISLTIVSKYIPTKVEGDRGDTKIIIIRPGENQLGTETESKLVSRSLPV